MPILTSAARSLTMESCPSRISKIMKPEEFIQSKLERLSTKSEIKSFSQKQDLEAEIYRLLMNKKFRKYSVTPEYQKHIKKAISLNVDRNLPIKLTFPFGGYKLWRLKETPEVDWAELFTLIYYTNWLSPICDIYPAGVWFNFYSDDFIVPRMNNIERTDVDSYRHTFQNLLLFLNKYLPDNLKFTLTRVIDQYKNIEEFETDLHEKIAEAEKEFNANPTINEKMRTQISLNVKPTDKQTLDTHWLERTHILHQAYLRVKYKRPYYRTEDNILAFSSPITDSIAVGTTKRSIAKFWCGVGVLEKEGDTYHDLVLSPKQSEDIEFEKYDMSISGLTGKNFNSIKINKC